MSAAPKQATQASPAFTTVEEGFPLVDDDSDGLVSLGEAASAVVDRLRRDRAAWIATMSLMVDFEGRDLPIAEAQENSYGSPRLWSVRVGTAWSQSVHFVGYSREHAERVAAAFNWRPEPITP